MKRLFDILLSGIALIALSPIILIVIIILGFTGEREIFYVQQRVGANGRMFGLLKFATMLKDSPGMGTGTVTVKNDPRVLPFGKILRKTKINELPQLVNVLKGDMSIVGPRPQALRCFEVFPEDVKREILKVRPGLSGPGSIIFRNEEDILYQCDNPVEFYDRTIAPYKGKLEKWYVENARLTVYFMMIFVTLWVVVFHRSQIVWTAFPDLPLPPPALRRFFAA